MFLQEVAADLYTKYGRELSQMVMVFPNKRPSVYFRRHLGNLIDQPMWSPEMLTIHEFIQRSSDKLMADRLLQSFLLYEAYTEQMLAAGDSFTSSYEQFFSLGEILLNDYAELESNCINHPDIYGNMADLAAIDQGLEYLTEEQKDYLRRFWQNFSPDRLSLQKEKFLQLWRRLPAIFQSFGNKLAERNLVTTGNLYRNLVANSHDLPGFLDNYQKIVFIGFNALNRAELQLFRRWQDEGRALFYFDADTHYIQDPLQEAGLFLRRNLELFGNELPVSNTINRTDRAIHQVAAEGNAAQVRTLPQLLDAIPSIKEHPEKVAIFLGDEKQLMPVLHALPDSIPYINITMGYGLSQSPVFSLVQTIIRVQESLQQQGGKRIFYQPLLQLLQHPYLYEVTDAAQLAGDIQNKSLVSIPRERWMHIEEKRIRQALTPVEEPLALLALIRNILEIQATEPATGVVAELEAQLLSATYFQLNRLEDLLRSFHHPLSLAFIGDTLLQLLRAHSVPLEGEPLRGLQVMGLLESRGLDFEHIILLDMNEGVLPKKAAAPTFIPDSIRRAYGLSVMEKQDAIFAYVFYRLLQRSQTVYCLYNSTTNENGAGERSRFLAQLEYETNIPFIRQQVKLDIAPLARPPITIQKDTTIQQTLRKYLSAPLSPSAINTYLECRLRFYFQNVQKIREPESFQEEIDAKTLGTILHAAIEFLYLRLQQEKNGDTMVLPSDTDTLKEWIPWALDRAFAQTLAGDPEHRVDFTGSYKVIRQVIHIYINEVLANDKAYAPFRMRNLESHLDTLLPVKVGEETWNIKLGGIIDRVDEKNGVLRIIDYKTGKDSKDFKGVASLFDRNSRDRNKAVLQTFIYARVLRQQSGLPVVAGLYDVRNMKKAGAGFDWRFRDTSAGEEGLDHFAIDERVSQTMEQLQPLLEEIFDPQVPFDQTSRVEKCQYCPYSTLCGR